MFDFPFPLFRWRPLMVCGTLALGVIMPTFGSGVAPDGPPPGSHVPGELKLAGPSQVEEKQPLSVDLWAIKPERPSFYSYGAVPDHPRMDLTVEVRDAKGAVVATATPRLRHGRWQKVELAADGLSAGTYVVVAEIGFDDLPYNRVSKEIEVLTPGQFQALAVTGAEALASGGGFSLTPLEASRFKQVAVLPAGQELTLPVPAGQPRAVYATLAGLYPAYQARVGSREESGVAATTNMVTQEVYLGAGQEGETVSLRAEAGDLKIAQIRWAPLTPAEAKLAAHTKSVKRDKAVTVNNDGFSEGYFDPSWNPLTLPLQVDRYKATDATQLDWCSLVSDVAGYPSKHVDFYGEDHEGTWVTAGNEAAYRHYRTLQNHEPPMYPWLVALGRAFDLPIWGSLRMSVSYGNHPFGESLNGKLWFAKPELRIKRSPGEQDNNDNPLSFAFREVQDRRIGVLREMAEMGCVGVNLDYCRYPGILGYDEPLLKAFQEKHGEDGKQFTFDHPKWVVIRQAAHNEFLRRLRASLDAVGKAQGRTIPISIRLPATKYETFGFDPETWVKEKLVDVLIPGFPGFDRWFDVAPWVALAKKGDAKVWVNIEYFLHETAQTELTDEEVARGVKPGYQFKNVWSDYLRRGAEAYAAGADGIYVFNRWNDPGIFYGLADSEYVRRWQRFENPNNLNSEAPVASGAPLASTASTP